MRKYFLHLCRRATRFHVRCSKHLFIRVLSRITDFGNRNRQGHQLILVPCNTTAHLYPRATPVSTGHQKRCQDAQRLRQQERVSVWTPGHTPNQRVTQAANPSPVHEQASQQRMMANVSPGKVGSNFQTGHPPILGSLPILHQGPREAT